MKLKSIIKQTIDIHVHIGPEIVPRKYTVKTLVEKEQGKIGGFVLKNHFYATTPFIAEIKDVKKLQVFGSIALNNAVGGMNKEAIYAVSLVSDKSFIVWFPTINAENFLNNSTYEIAPEWVQKNNFKARFAKDIKSVKVTENGKLTKETIEVLKMIKKCNAILATGHISWQESEMVVKKAKEIGIENIVITHPIYQRIDMPIAVQKKLAKIGCFLEQCFSMYSIDKIDIKKIAAQIKILGSKSIILSSDVGQTFSPQPSNALLEFANLLFKNGINESDLYQMMVINPKKLLSITK